MVNHPDIPPPPPDYISPRGVHWWKDIMMTGLAESLKLGNTSVWLASEHNGRHFSRVVVTDGTITFAHPMAITIHDFLKESANKA